MNPTSYQRRSRMTRPIAFSSAMSAPGSICRCRTRSGVAAASAGATVMDRRRPRADAREEEASHRPVGLEASAATAVVEELHPDGVRPPAIDDGLDHTGAQIDGRVPADGRVAAPLRDEGLAEARLRGAVGREEGLREPAATHRRQPLVDHAALV